MGFDHKVTFKRMICLFAGLKKISQGAFFLNTAIQVNVVHCRKKSQKKKSPSPFIFLPFFFLLHSTLLSL